MTRTDALRRLGAAAHTPRGARELLVGSLGCDPYERITELRAAGERKARAEGVVYQMEHERHVVLARIAAEIAGKSKESLSEAKLDRLARADPRYADHIKGTAAAIEERDLATSEYYSIRSELLMDEHAIQHLSALSRLEGTPIAESRLDEWRQEGAGETDTEPTTAEAPIPNGTTPAPLPDKTEVQVRTEVIAECNQLIKKHGPNSGLEVGPLARQMFQKAAYKLTSDEALALRKQVRFRLGLEKAGAL